MEERDWLLISESHRPNMITSSQFGTIGTTTNPISKGSGQDSSGSSAAADREFQIVIHAKQGLGLSLVSRDPYEELLYAHMSNVVVDYQSTRSHQILDGSVQVESPHCKKVITLLLTFFSSALQNIQIDNQIPDCMCPTILYLSPSNKNDEKRHLPAVHFTADRAKNPNSVPGK